MVWPYLQSGGSFGRLIAQYRSSRGSPYVAEKYCVPGGTKNMKKVLIFTALLVVACIGFAGVARADSTGTLILTGCGPSGGSGCPDATYTFDIGDTSATLTILITGTVNADNNLITGVNLGTEGLNITGLNVTGPNAGWLAAIGSVNSNSNCLVGGGAFMCAYGSVGITTGGSY